MNNQKDSSNRKNQRRNTSSVNQNFINASFNKQGHIKIDVRKLQRFNVSQEEILSVLHLSQADAAERLGISVATLKRRFYEMDMGRWPYHKHNAAHQNVNPSGSASLTSNRVLAQAGNAHCFFSKRVAISKLVNEKDEEEKYLAPQTCLELAMAFCLHSPRTTGY